ncbi:MAG: hypothetical protein IKC59_00940 [Clostridia bacterium]|nr:hypothetical protein [Clostridia bacterium]
MKHNFKKILSVLLTVCMLLGTMSALMIPASAATLAHNTVYEINGVKMQFDEKGHGNSTATVNDDGTVTLKMGRGDMLWFPEVKIDAQSVIHTEVLFQSGTAGSACAGTTWNIKTATGHWATASDSASIAALRTNNRITVGETTFALSNTNADFKLSYHTSSATFENYTVTNESFGATWQTGQTVVTDISKNGNIVTATFTDGDGVAITSMSYDDSSFNAYQGAVGYMGNWCDQFTYVIKNYTIKNALVNGVRQDFDMVSALKTERENIAVKKDVVINGLTLRIDPHNNHPYASLKINNDGTLTMSGNRGDLFWIPNVEVSSKSVIKTSVTMDAASDVTKASAGTIFNVDANGAWNEDSDTAMIAALRPYNGNSRRTLGQTNFAVATLSADYSKILSEVNYTPTNASFGNTWALGAMVTTTISQKADGTVEAVFTDGNGDFIIDASYNNSEYPFEGAVGYMTHWSNSDAYYEYTIHEYTITNAIVNGVEVAEFDLIAELAAYMSKADTYTMKSNLSLNGVIGLNVRIDDNYYITDKETVVVTNENGDIVATKTIADLYNAANGYYAITIPVNAKEMNDVYTVSVKDGENVLKTVEVSVKEYANALLNNSAYADWHELIRAMLGFGAAAQQVLDYKTDALVADISGVNYDFSNIGSLSVSSNTDKLAGLFATLTLESDTALNLYFKTKDDEALTFTVNGNDVAATTTEDGFIRLTIADLAADQLADEFAIVVNGGEIEITISATQWAKLVVNGDETDEMKTLAKALAAYADAAQKKNK